MRLSIARRLVTLALVPAALFGAVAVGTPAQAAVLRSTQLEVSVAYWTNQMRTVLHCPQVKVDTRLASAARGHSAWMAKTGTFSHIGTRGTSFVTRIKSAGYSSPQSENIAWGYREGKEVLTAWMQSPGHRANLANCAAKSVGIGVAFAANGNPYYTQYCGSK
jgi:uncharacterized protein YkwD